MLNRCGLAVINTFRELSVLSTICDVLSAFSRADDLSVNLSYICKEKSSNILHLLANYVDSEI